MYFRKYTIRTLKIIYVCHAITLNQCKQYISEQYIIAKKLHKIIYLNTIKQKNESRATISLSKFNFYVSKYVKYVN